MFNGRNSCAILGDQGGKAGIGHHVVAGRDNAAVADKSDAEFTAGQEFQGNITAGMQADAGYLEDTIDGCLTLYHEVTMAELLQVVKMQPPHSLPGRGH